MVNVFVDDLQVLYISSSDPTYTNFYPEVALGLVSRSNFYPEILLRVPAKMIQFLSGQCYGFSKKFENFYPDWDLGSKGTFRGPVRRRLE